MLKHLKRVIVAALCCGALSAAAVAEEAWEFSERINRGTISVISGGINGTYVRIASDLSSVLDNGDDLRILPIMGKGSVQNIDDLLYLKGIDIGIVQSDVLEFVKQENKHPTIEERIRYITKLYNEEFHLLANSSITETVPRLIRALNSQASSATAAALKACSCRRTAHFPRPLQGFVAMVACSPVFCKLPRKR